MIEEKNIKVFQSNLELWILINLNNCLLHLYCAPMSVVYCVYNNIYIYGKFNWTLSVIGIRRFNIWLKHYAAAPRNYTLMVTQDFLVVFHISRVACTAGFGVSPFVSFRRTYILRFLLSWSYHIGYYYTSFIHTFLYRFIFGFSRVLFERIPR